MADPEQIYQEVLSEEQGKGSAAPVAEGRAKAARQRAVMGSPHPKEPKWWPGSQPHLEGGDGAAPAEAEEAPAAEAEEAPAEEEPAQEPAAAEEAAPAAEEAAPAAEEQAPAAEEQAPAAAAPPPAQPVAEPPEPTRDQPAAPAPAAQPAGAPAPVAPAATAVAPEAAPVRPRGAMHGTAAGNRLRPEDAVSTEVQFDAQEALRQRRKMIDELVTTGVPAVSARRERRGGGVGMLLLYLLIPVVAVAFLVANQDDLGAGGGEGEQTQGGGGGLTISAANVQFDTDQLTIPADGATLTFVNDDSVEHNVAIYESDAAQEEIFVGEIIPGGQETTYDIPAHDQGEYYFQCDVHPGMNGTATVE